jgi:MFS-type transporter involved in bile tolerance (Atg22 family)
MGRLITIKSTKLLFLFKLLFFLDGVNAQNSLGAMCHLMIGRGWAELVLTGC